MRPIDADALTRQVVDKLHITNSFKDITDLIDKAPTIDAVQVIRCEYCRHWNSETKGCKRNPSVEAWQKDDFCKYGKRWTNAID